MKEKIALISIVANSFLAVGKIIVGSLSGSVAILAEGLHSFMDIFSSAIGYIGIKISKKPADEKNPYGYHKAEVLAGVAITLILLVTGLGIIREAYLSFLKPEHVETGLLVFGIMALSAIINEVMARVKIHFGKKEDSIALLSDGLHSRIDVLASLLVFVGLFLNRYFIYTDSILALLIGLYIIKESFSLGKEAIDSLLDVSAGEEVEKKIREITEGEGIEVSSLKTQKKGAVITLSLEIVLSKDLKVDEATKISNCLREKLIKEIDNLHYIEIQIVSHETGTGFYKPTIGQSFGWRRQGPGGCCICSQCGYRIEHQRGIACASLKCPNCDLKLTRDGQTDKTEKDII